MTHKPRKAEASQIFFDTLDSPIGTLTIVFSGGKLTGIASRRPPGAKPGKMPPAVRRQLEDYFSGSLREFSVEIALSCGTEFEKTVWLAISEVPYGETRTYKWLAGRIGKPGACRAVGRALAKNPIPIVLPCHRIIESDGHIGGYSCEGGVDLKRRLLDMEYYRSLKG